MKKILTLLVFPCIVTFVFSQPKNWQHLDLKIDSIFGISTNKAYTDLLKNKKAVPVIVAVIDSGVDTTHEDLAAVLWKNKRESNRKINRIDDDHNGYVDDIYGWSFIEGITYANLELTRLLRERRNSGDTLGDYILLKDEFLKSYRKAEANFNGYKKFSDALQAISDGLGTDNPTFVQLKQFKPVTSVQSQMLQAVMGQIAAGTDFITFKKWQIDAGVNYYKNALDYHLNLQFIPVHGAQSNNVAAGDVEHGTHVAGIIGAERNNKKGIDGIADVRIMSIRAVPDGDERDEDIAKAVTYAVANGAKVINMSFGKGYSPNKKLVDDAVRYAMSKDVLLVHGSGNDGKDLDSAASFPTKKYADGGEANAWLEVGASSFTNNESLAAGFSNYGKNTVDVFAPGVNIYSSTPGSKYTYHDGTSMAAPVVAGIAALIRSHYPKLTAVQVKEIIMNSVIKADALKNKCKTGGVVNAYEALKLAATYK